MSQRLLWIAGLALLLFFGVGCDLFGGDDDEGDDEAAVTSFVSSVRTGNQEATLEEGNFPQAGTGNAPTLSGSNQLVRGGSLVMQVSTDDDIDEMLIGVLNQGGYYRLNVGGASQAVSARTTTSAELRAFKLEVSQGTSASAAQAPTAPVQEGNVYTVIITSAANEDYSALPLQVATRTDDEVSQVATFNVGVNEQAAGSEQLQVSLNWNQPVDLDLHLETPNEEDIYYGNPFGASGGTLDLDSNAGCGIDGVNNENITWGEETPASGDYVVRVDLWSACEVTQPISFVVTVNACGTVSVHEGTFQPSEEDFGGAFDGRVITRLNGLSFPCAAR